MELREAEHASEVNVKISLREGGKGMRGVSDAGGGEQEDES